MLTLDLLPASQLPRRAIQYPFARTWKRLSEHTIGRPITLATRLVTTAGTMPSCHAFVRSSVSHFRIPMAPDQPTLPAPQGFENYCRAMALHYRADNPIFEICQIWLASVATQPVYCSCKERARASSPAGGRGHKYACTEGSDHHRTAVLNSCSRKYV